MLKYFRMERTAEERLMRLGRRRAAAQVILAEIREDMPALVRELFAAGHTKTEIARMAHLTPPAVDSMLKQTTS